MSIHKFEEDCPDCLPVLVDFQTRKPMPMDAPAMQAIMAVWRESTLEEKTAFHNVCCLNSGDAKDLTLGLRVAERMEGVLKLVVQE